MGKNKVVAYHRQVPYRVLERIPEKSVLDSRGSDCGNMVIHGDNLEALKALLPEYEGKVDCIYIDPPYNTGNVDELKDVDLMSEECPIRFIITVEALSEGLGLPVRLCPGNRREVVHELCGHLYFLLYDVVRVVIFNGSDGKHGLVLAAVDSSAPRQKLFDYLFGKGRTVMDSGAETDSVISFFRYFRIPVSWHASFTYIFLVNVDSSDRLKISL